MTPDELDAINAAIATHAHLARVLMDHRRQLFDALVEATHALRVAERHLKRDSRYVTELLARRVPLDVADRAEAVLEGVAHDPRMR